jgi:hypothetical protein
MTLAATLDANLPVTQPTPPPPPATLEETGLHPDTLAQILLKTLVAGEASGTSLSEKLRLPYSVLDTVASRSCSRCVARAARARPATAMR